MFRIPCRWCFVSIRCLLFSVIVFVTSPWTVTVVFIVKSHYQNGEGFAVTVRKLRTSFGIWEFAERITCRRMVKNFERQAAGVPRVAGVKRTMLSERFCYCESGKTLWPSCTRNAHVYSNNAKNIKIRSALMYKSRKWKIVRAISAYLYSAFEYFSWSKSRINYYRWGKVFQRISSSKCEKFKSKINREKIRRKCLSRTDGNILLCKLFEVKINLPKKCNTSFSM